MRYLSLFSGIEAASVAWEPLGWEPVAFCEVDEFASAVLAHRYPDVPNLGDITKVDWKKFKEEHGTPDVLVGGSPCFVAGTMVLTDTGFKPIEEIREGDLVVTHKKHLKRVLKTGKREAHVGILDIRGAMNITCTPGHPFLVSDRTKVWDASNKRYRFEFGKERWCSAKDSVGTVACLPNGHFDIEVPEIPTPYDLSVQDVMELIGWYLGDGSIAGKGKRNPTLRTLILSINPQKLVEFDIAFGNRLNKRVSRNSKTQITINIYATELCNFIEKHFGRGCATKNIPPWVFAMDEESKQRLFMGYMKTDGCSEGNGNYNVVSTSEALVLGMQMLTGIGSANKQKPRKEGTIKGYTFIPKQLYKYSHQVPKGEKYPSGFWHDNGFTKRLVRSYTELDEMCTVYNLEVEDDNSYTANGVAVHNCQSFSIAGGRESLDGESRLMYEYIRACREVQSTYVLWENVPGSLNTKDNAFAQLIDSLQDCGYCDLSWRVLDAQFFGVAQRRRRVFLVGHLAAGGGCSAAVLFDANSCEGNPPSSKDKREALAAAAGRGAGGIGGEGCRTVAFAQNQHKNKTLLCVASGQANAEHGEGFCPTLSARQFKDPPIVIDRAAFNQGVAAKFPPHVEQTELMDTLVARGPHAVAYRQSLPTDAM